MEVVYFVVDFEMEEDGDFVEDDNFYSSDFEDNLREMVGWKNFFKMCTFEI